MEARRAAWVRHVVDYGGLVAFLVVLLATRSLVTATWGLVVGAAGALAVGFIFERRVAPMPLVTGLLALFFGGLTLFFHDSRFIKMKPTIVYLGFAVFLFAGHLRGHNPLRALMGEAFHLPEPAVRTLTLRYAVFFLALALANEAIWRTQSDTTWGWFKVGVVGLIFIFSLAQAPLLIKYAEHHEADAPEK